ncbi:MAG TPA: amino acid permease [Terriglobales bacterium]|jgi:APA family basic amino acid/polyamine antiporter|nr:amino acid permease [Terriglobales bacterium]
MPAQALPSTSKPGLIRDLSAMHAASVVIGTVIGSGIFLVPAEMMKAAGSARFVFLAWIVGGLFSFCGAVTYAQLGAMKPQAGGEYVYIRDAFGQLAGFLCAWTWILVVKPTSLAGISTGIVRVLSNFPALSFLILPDGHLTNRGKLVAILFVIFVSFLNYIGIRRAGNFQLAFTALKIVVILAVAALAFTSPGSWSHFSDHYSGAIGGMTGFVLAVAAALWAFDGWSDLNMIAEEVRSPAKNIPLAMLGGFGVIAALYLLVNLAVQYVLPALAIGQSASPMSDAVTRSVLGPSAALIGSAAIVVSLLTSLNGVAMSGARMAFAVSRDGNFFSSLAKVHERYHTPHTATIFQAALSIVCLLVGGSFRQLFTLALFSEWLSYVAASIALFVFRSRRNTGETGTNYWQFPVAPALFILASVGLLYYTFSSNLRYSIVGSLIISAGIPMYYAFVLRRRV